MKFERRSGFPQRIDGRVKFVVVKNDDVHFIGFPNSPQFHADCVEVLIKQRGGEFFCAGFIEKTAKDIKSLTFDSESCRKEFGCDKPRPLPEDWELFKKELLVDLERYLEKIAF